MTQKTLADARVVAYGYDADGNLTSVTPPGRPPTVPAYDDRNVLTSVDAGERRGLRPDDLHARDADRALTSIARPGNQAVILAYDGGGRLASRMLKTGATTSAVTTFGYDPTSGALATITGSDGIVVASTYDGSLLASKPERTGRGQRVPDLHLRLTPATETVAGTGRHPARTTTTVSLIGAGALAITRATRTTASRPRARSASWPKAARATCAATSPRSPSKRTRRRATP